MIHYHMEMKPEGEPVMEFKIAGNLTDITTELVLLINMVYNTVADNSRAAAGLLKGRIQDMIDDDKSAVWEVDKRLIAKE